MQAIFRVQSPTAGQFQFVVSHDQPVVIGRGSASSVRIDDPGLSRRHCRISLTPQGLLCQDLGSSNGTFVNGEQINQRFLRPGDEVTIGQTIMRPFPAGAGGQAPAPQPYGGPRPGGYPQMAPNTSGEMVGSYNMPQPGGMQGRPGYGGPPAGGMGGPGMGSMGPGMGGGMGGMGSMGSGPQSAPFGAVSSQQGFPGRPAGPQQGYGGAQQGYGGPPQGYGGAPPAYGQQGAMGSLGPGARPQMAPQQPMDPSMIGCSRCGTYFKGTRAQIHWRDRKGDPSLLVCETCKDRERMSQDQVHGYELLDVLGKGAMGIVYKARRQATGEIVALKIVNLEGDPNGFQNFLREARTGASVQHPNSVKTIEMGESSGKFYLTMEFVEGKTLEDVIKERGCLDQNLVMNMGYVLLDVMEAARKADVVHRDLKPANILVSHTGEPKITDFGLAKLITDAGKSGLTAPGDLRGTPMFMPPEQLENAAMVDHRADLYSLGALLYNALTNSYPFKVKTLRDLCMALEKEEPTPASDLNPRVSPHLSQFVAKLMAKKPDDRFQTAAEAQQALRAARERILAGQ